MITKLLFKDVKVFGRNILLFTLFWLIISDVMITFGEDSWRPYIFIGMVQISVIIGYYTVFDKIKKGEILIGSLPTTRTSIVVSRYLSAVSIAALGIFVWFINAYSLKSISASTPGDFYLNFRSYSLFFVTAYLTIFISIFIPVVIKYSKIWALVALIYMGAVVFLFSIKLLHNIFYNYFAGSGSINFGFSIIFILILCFCLFVSAMISIKIYNTIDL
jgi:hypothetical protein